MLFPSSPRGSCGSCQGRGTVTVVPEQLEAFVQATGLPGLRCMACKQALLPEMLLGGATAALASLPGSPALGAAGWWLAACPLGRRRVPGPRGQPQPRAPFQEEPGERRVGGRRPPAACPRAPPVLRAAGRQEGCSPEASTRWDASRGVTEIVLGWFDPAHRTDTENPVILVYPGLDKPKYVHNWDAATKLNQPFL